MSNNTKIQKFIDNNTLTVDEDVLYPTNGTDIFVIHVDSLPIIISFIEYTEDNGYIGFDADDNEYFLEGYALLLYKLQQD